jgi:hypothetical protein
MTTILAQHPPFDAIRVGPLVSTDPAWASLAKSGLIAVAMADGDSRNAARRSSTAFDERKKGQSLTAPNRVTRAAGGSSA